MDIVVTRLVKQIQVEDKYIDTLACTTPSSKYSLTRSSSSQSRRSSNSDISSPLTGEATSKPPKKKMFVELGHLDEHEYFGEVNSILSKVPYLVLHFRR